MTFTWHDSFVPGAAASPSVTIFNAWPGTTFHTVVPAMPAPGCAAQLNSIWIRFDAATERGDDGPPPDMGVLARV